MFSAGQGGGHYASGFTDPHQLAPEIALSNKFPGKLWRLVNSCKTGSIKWGQAGNTVIIHQTHFQQEFLDPPNTMFKTTNIGSFIRQLNLYGFRKLNVVRFAESTTPDMREVHEFQNDFFHRGRPELLAYLKRNVGIRRTRDLAVKRRLESLDCPGGSVKHARYTAQGLTYAPSFLGRHPAAALAGPGFQPGSLLGGTPSMYHPHHPQGQGAGTGKWPVYMHWDKSCGVCKYVVLPDTGSNTLPASINGNPVVYSPVQGPDGRYYPVVKLPGDKQEDPPQEYYLVKILPEAFQQENFPKEIIPCYPAEPGEYNKILGGGDASWSCQSEAAAVPKHSFKDPDVTSHGRSGAQGSGPPFSSSGGLKPHLPGDVPDRSGDASHPARGGATPSTPSTSNGSRRVVVSSNYNNVNENSLKQQQKQLQQLQNSIATTNRAGNHGSFSGCYGNDADDSESEFSSSDSEDADSTLCRRPDSGAGGTGARHPSLGMFDGEPRVMCEGGRTVGLNELVQMAATVLTQAQAQEVVNLHARSQVQHSSDNCSNSATRSCTSNSMVNNSHNRSNFINYGNNNKQCSNTFKQLMENKSCHTRSREAVNMGIKAGLNQKGKNFSHAVVGSTARMELSCQNSTSNTSFKYTFGGSKNENSLTKQTDRSTAENHGNLGSINTPLMDISTIKHEILSPVVGLDLDSPMGDLNAALTQLGGLGDTLSPLGGPWTMVGGMTLMENSKVKVEMMETCNNMTAGFGML